MKPTNFTPLLDAVKEAEKKEFIQAVLEHGGEFAFPDGEFDIPVNVICRDGEDTVTCRVLSVVLNRSRDDLDILVRDRKGEEYRISSGLLLPGEVYNILERMFAIGDKVHWLDPAISDYEHPDEALARVFTVVDADNPEIMLIREEGCPEGCETEVPFYELRHAGAPAGLMAESRFVRAFAEALSPEDSKVVFLKDDGKGKSVKGFRMDASNGLSMTLARTEGSR